MSERTINTAADLDRMPPRSVILDKQELSLQKVQGKWAFGDAWVAARDVRLPAVILWEADA